jgi:nitroreductase/NAD-dependent dihydropyrimidine dehydrogenase PreA subunit
MKFNVNLPSVLVDKCTGCGLCFEVCPSFVLEITKGKSWVVRGDWCIGCGHCGAVCPEEAIAFSTSMIKRHPQPNVRSAASPETLALLLQERRSIRLYERKPIPEDILRRILDAGRHAPTGRNSQNVRYVLLQSPNEIEQLRKMTLSFYQKIFSRIKSPLGAFVLSLIAGRRIVTSLRESLPKMEYAGKLIEQGKDCLFYHAPVVVVAHAESWDTCSAFNCSASLYNCSLMAQTLGIGCCFNGYLVNAVNHDRGIKEWLNLPHDHRCFAAMTLGYQKIRFQTLVEREAPNVQWR